MKDNREKGGFLPLEEHKKYTLSDLEKVMEILLGEGGCPWDKEQTHESLRQYLLEESYEVIEAINKQDDTGLCEELGDVLFQVMFHGALANKRGAFDLTDIIDGVYRKMVSRHTHIFGREKEDVHTPGEVLDVWEKNKAKEKNYKSPKERLEKVPKELPALIRAYKVLHKAAGEKDTAAEFNENIDGIISLLNSLKDAETANETEVSEQMGQLLFKMVNISRYLQINAEFALTNATEKFINRFEYISDASHL